MLLRCGAPVPCAAVLRHFLFAALLILLALHASGATALAPKRKSLPPIGVSVPRGFCDGPVSLELRCPAGALIRFTLDGTEPTPANGANYSGPLRITNTTLLRAAAFKADARLSAVATHSYIFLDQVLRQPKEPPGLPKV